MVQHAGPSLVEFNADDNRALPEKDTRSDPYACADDTSASAQWQVMSACYYLHHHTSASSYIRPLLPNGEIARTAEVAALTSGGGCRRNALNVSATPNRALNPSSTRGISGVVSGFSEDV